MWSVARAGGACVRWVQARARLRSPARWRVRARRARRAVRRAVLRRMHATGHTDRSGGGGGGGGSWRLPPDETLQVADPKSAKEEVRHISSSPESNSIPQDSFYNAGERSKGLIALCDSLFILYD